MTQPFSFPSLASVVLDAEELHRQWQLSQLLSQELGSVAQAAQVEAASLHTALDVACGVGGWTLALAQAAPSVQVSGIDCHPKCISFAQRMARQRGLGNAKSLVQDPHALETAIDPYAPNRFDLVHLAFLAPMLLTTDYPALLHTLAQLTRPGGILLWTEMELPITTSSVFERLTAQICSALETAGQSFFPPIFQEIAQLFAQMYRQAGQQPAPAERRQLGITMMMGRWLRESGCQQVSSLAHALEVSTGTRAHPAFVRQVEVGLRQIRPHLLAQGVLDEEAFAQLSSQVLEEVQQPDFCGLCYLLTVRGQIPP